MLELQAVLSCLTWVQEKKNQNKKLELMEEQPIQRLILNQIAKTCECHETLYFILLLSVRTNVIKSSN